VNGSDGGFARDSRVGSSEVMAAVAGTCRNVPTSAYASSNSDSSSTAPSGTLYDCAGRADALLATAG
jgi:hypothetical protein